VRRESTAPIEAGELLVVVADSGWATNEFPLIARVSAACDGGSWDSRGTRELRGTDPHL
jgi:hypothetical protein